MPQVKLTSPLSAGSTSAISAGCCSVSVTRTFWAGRTISLPHSPALLS